MCVRAHTQTRSHNICNNEKKEDKNLIKNKTKNKIKIYEPHIMRPTSRRQKRVKTKQIKNQ